MPEALLTRPLLEAARAILGWRLVRDGGSDASGRRVGRIVEVEAYGDEHDPASHARFGQTARNEVMFGPPGRAYVYLVYGMHDCLNVVTGPIGTPSALLVRAVEPIEGVAEMRAARARRGRERRRTDTTSARPPSARPPSIPDVRLASGPGLVCAAFDLDRSLTGTDLFDLRSAVRIEPPPADEPPPVILRGPRVGIAYAGQPSIELPWRFAIAANPAISRPALDPPDPSAARPVENAQPVADGRPVDNALPGDD